MRKLQGEYKIGMEIDFSYWVAAFRSPIMKLSDFLAFMKLYKALEEIIKMEEKRNLAS